jgi:hypothetical protein
MQRRPDLQDLACNRHGSLGRTPASTSLDFPKPSLSTYVPVLGDFDGDGTWILSANRGSTRPWDSCSGKGDGTFQAHAIASPSSSAWSAAAADLNGDGRLDLASITSERIRGHRTSGQWRPGHAVRHPRRPTATPSPPGNLLLADLDNDGHVDLVAAETSA